MRLKPRTDGVFMSRLKKTKTQKHIEKLVERRREEPNPLDEPAPRVFEIKKSNGETVKAVWQRRSDMPVPADYESRSRMASIRLTPTIERILRKRAKRHCGGNLSEWMVWASLEFTPPTRKIVIAADG